MTRRRTSPQTCTRRLASLQATLQAQVGTKVDRSKDGISALWTVVDPSTSPYPKPCDDQDELRCKFGLVNGCPLIQGEPDLLALWLLLYPGDMEAHLDAMNSAGMRSNSKFQPITEHEYVRFWGMCIAARHSPVS